ncbi:hypothetical protein [Shewanella sp.]|uniref:hypothetical protein n=1 Tax=Shewanella sp. TaxID=50422 RepID=UPI003D13A363
MPSSIVLSSPIISKGVYLMGMLTLDIDANAERYVVLERNTLAVLHHNRPPASGIVNLLIPAKFATSGLIVGIVDDDGQYNIKMFDGVTCDLVNANLAEL